MDEILLNQVLQNRARFLSIFTSKQLAVIDKMQRDKSLSNAERKAFYVGIKPKLDALQTLQSEQLYLRGNLLPERLREAAKILKKFPGEQAFIAGSFLTAKDYNDIDVYLIRERGYKEEFQDNLHIIYITPKHLAKPVIQSAAMTSVGNVNTIATVEKSRIKLDNLMSIYHEAVIEMVEKRKKKEAVRDLTFLYFLYVNDELVDRIKLHRAMQETSLTVLSHYFCQLCNVLFSKSYLYVHIQDYLRNLRQTAETVKNNVHLLKYIETYQELLYGQSA